MKRPNILWICTDQQRYDTIGALGNEHVSTPNIDKIVTGGVSFTRTYCQSPICTPSRASFLTGHYPSTIHVTGNGNESFPKKPDLVTKMLSDAGYDCGLIGKLHLASAYGRIEPRGADGYRYWQYSHAPRDDWDRGHDYADWVRSHGEVLADLIEQPDGVPVELHQTTWCAEKTIEFINEERDQPWLASVNIYDPHPPFNPPKEYRDQFDPQSMPGPLFSESDLVQQERLSKVDFQSQGRRPTELDVRNPLIAKQVSKPNTTTSYNFDGKDARSLQAAYYAMIKLIDDRVGDIINALEESDQLEDTVVIFTSDHGETLGDHGLIQKGCRFYEGLVRVPLIFSFPAQFHTNLRKDALVELLDIAPTLLQLGGVEVPNSMQGRSLLELLRGDEEHHRDFVRCEYYDGLDLPDGTFATMYRDERYKLVVYHAHGEGELYDLEEDPNEFENMWSDATAQELKLALMKSSFDASMLAMDKGPRRTGPM